MFKVTEDNEIEVYSSSYTDCVSFCEVNSDMSNLAIVSADD